MVRFRVRVTVRGQGHGLVLLVSFRVSAVVTAKVRG